MFGDVFDSDEAFELKRIAHHQQALEFVLVEQGFGFLRGDPFGHGDQLVQRGHDFAHLHVVALLKAQITACDDAHHLLALAHRKARNAHLLGHGHDLSDRVLRGDDHRVAQHATFVAFHFGHFSGLLLGGEIFVHDADATLLGDGNRQTGLGHRVHGR